MGSIGTLAWARRTQGHLSGRERLAFTVQGVRAQTRDLTAHAAHRLGIRRERLARVDLDSVRFPDSQAAKEAEQVCQSIPDYLREHSYRSYLWAIALADVDGLSFDEELLFCACMVHDAGVPRALEKRSSACFTLESAAVAEETARKAGWPAERTERIAEAMTLHINAWLPVEQGVEAHLLGDGTLVDGIGRRHWQVDPEYVRQVLERYPRLRFKERTNVDFREHGRQAPRARIAFYYRYGGLKTLVNRAPYDA